MDSSFENPYFNQQRILLIAEEIIKRRLNISYYINIRASFHKIATPELMQKMIDSGLVNVFVGIESFFEEDLRLFNKSSTLEDGERILQVLQQYPVNIDIGLINFHSKSTIISLRKNAQTLQKYNLSSRLSILNRLMIYKGTPLYDYLETENMVQGEYYELTNYKFSDPRIEVLNHFIFDIIKNENLNPLLSELDLFEHRHITLVYHMKHYLKNLGDFDSLAIVVKYEKKLELWLSKLNEINTSWFMELLDLLENGWNEKEAAAIFIKDMNRETISQYLRQLKNDNLQLYRKLSKQNRDYLHQL